MKRNKKVRRTCKLPISKLQRKLWIYCKALTRKIHGNECYTCGKKGLEGSDWHTSHFIPKATCGAYLKYDLRNLRPACYNCNINLGGNGAIFYQKMVIREGQEYVDQIFKDKLIKLPGKLAYEHFEMLTEKHKLMMEEM